MSSPAGTPNKKAKVDLTARDVELLAFAMQSMKDPNVQLDYSKFAALAGMTDGSARVTWGKIRRKLTAAASSPAAAGAPASAKSPAPKSKLKRARKPKADTDDDENDDAGTPESPSERVAERRKKVKKEAEAEADDTAAVDEEDDGVKVKDEVV